MKIDPEKAYNIKQLRHTMRWSLRRIAKHVGVSEGTVRNTLSDLSRATARRTREKNTGVMKARQEAITAIAKELVVEKVKGRNVIVGRKFASLGEMAAEYAKRTGATVAPATVCRDLAAAGFKSRVRPRVVNNDPVKNKERLLFARSMKRRGTLGKHIIFSDECWVNDNDNANHTEWVFGDETPTPRCYQKRPKIKLMVWGAIGQDFKSKLIFLEGKINAAAYQAQVVPEIESIMARYRQRHFMQDGARPHTAGTTMDRLASSRIISLKWPAHSPHLNPIEKLWNRLHQQIAALRPKSEEDLKAKAQAAWDSFTQAEINKFIGIFDSAIARTTENKGLPW